jgi:hypothetical protein
LFIHRNFPGQFRYVAPRLARDHGWRSTFLTADRHVSAPPGVTKINYDPGVAASVGHPVVAATIGPVGHALGAYEALRARPDLRPDLVVSHGSYGSTLFLPLLFDAPVINFFEYFYRATGQDLGYRADVPVTEDHLLRYRVNNAMTEDGVVLLGDGRRARSPGADAAAGAGAG